MSGKFRPSVNPAYCKACGYCREVCPAGVFDSSGEYNSNGYAFTAARHADECIGCGKCVAVCPDFAVTVKALEE